MPGRVGARRERPARAGWIADDSGGAAAEVIGPFRVLPAGSGSPEGINRGQFVTEEDMHVAGIERYASDVRTPPEYQMLNGTCGVILIWSK